MTYRPDIDGLRAIAVSIVILFHFGVPGFTGGFVGVDVFFVLSGYLIGSIILHQLDNSRFSFINFYFRRIRRLFPVFVVVMLVTTIIAWHIMLPDDFGRYGKSLVASTVYLSNILFYETAGYFDVASHLKPLLHTWSLSAEEQFYLVFPLLAWLVFKYKRTYLPGVLLGLTGLSFLAAVLYLPQDASAVFYLYPFRAWEMFLGVCLATGIFPSIKQAKLRGVLALTGLLLVVVPVFAYEKSTPFPGLSALAPCLGAWLLLYTGREGEASLTFTHRLLVRPTPVFIGKISYSLYLWHWPVFVLYMYRDPREPYLADILIMGVVTLAASVLSWKYIETPFREGRVMFSKKISSVYASTAIVSCMFIAFGFYLHKSKGIPERLEPEIAQFAQHVSSLFGDLSGCENSDNQVLPDIGYCFIGEPLSADAYTLVWADSHGAAYKQGLEQALGGDTKPVLLAWSGGCPPVFGVDKDESVSSRAIDQRCAKRNQAIKALIDKDKQKINAVVLVGRWSYYLNGVGVGVDVDNRIQLWSEAGQPEDIDHQGDFFIERLKATVNALRQEQLPVFVVQQPPEFSQFNGRKVTIKLMQGETDYEAFTTENYTEVQARQGAVLDLFDDLAANGQITLLPTHDFFCGPERCSLMVDGVPTYFDNNHISTYGAEKISGMFSPLVSFLNQ